MSDAISSNASSEISSASASADNALVTFSSETATATLQFADAPPSEWAFAAHEAAFDGEAIDAWRKPEIDGLLPLMAVATLIAAETELYADADDALVGMTPTPFAFDLAIDRTSAGDDAGMVMWSGQDSDADVASPIMSLARSETGLSLHDIVPHGISLDWTDAVLV